MATACDAVTLTIDGRPITVPPGTSILEAAADLGIDIPTLCYHPNIAASA
ncbi:MAG: 2Fe-2S iron-sulfur cluster-binding protein, partial [Chloroflexi bacterium]|nr:2Fe-2S iron-sulfur cluster-binding protein [Chloroflexota bacterium]